MQKYFRNHKYLLITIIIFSLIFSWLVLIYKGEYGITLFFTLPTNIGFFIGYGQRYSSETGEKFRKIIKDLLSIMLIVAVLSGLLILMGLEGAICILIAYPYLIIPMYLAYIAGIYIAKKDKINTLNSIVIVLLLNPATYIYDTYQKPIQDQIKTELIVNESKESIWNKLTTKLEFKKTPNLLFRKGVSYPKSINYKDQDGHKSYSCYTNNDTITLTIKEFVHFEKIMFQLKNQTVPMKELSPYNSIDAKHLHNYFKVNYGLIELHTISKNKTKIIAKTSYSYKIAPKWYWQLWSNYIIDEMHKQVLESIKENLDE
jgi:hypothetical protein